jgi:hypothetical protein
MTIRNTLLIAFWLLAGMSGHALAQGGPPLITNDPDTPGAGNWEINLAASGSHSDGSWELSLPDVDVNYGLGDRMQLSMHFGEAWARGEDGAWASGTGPVELALRFRFVDEESAGFALAVQPHWERSWSHRAIEKGLAPEHSAFGVPVQLAKTVGRNVAGIELTRTFVSAEADEWQLGVFWSRELAAPGRQLLAEAVAVRTDGGRASTLVNLGARQAIGEHLVLLGSLGHELDGPSRGTLFYLGIQLLAGP